MLRAIGCRAVRGTCTHQQRLAHSSLAGEEGEQLLRSGNLEALVGNALPLSEPPHARAPDLVDGALLVPEGDSLPAATGQCRDCRW